jgi:uncharacterized membrane protein YphA (DoxX/SURF4 family)
MAWPEEAMNTETLSPSRPLALSVPSLLARWLTVSLATVIVLIMISELLQQLSTPISIGIALAVGLAVAVYWTLHESTIDSAKWYDSFQVVIRFGLGYIFISYGIAKLFHAQFKPATFIQLDTPVGELPGIQLTWLFFGYSYAYACFIGLSQILCSMLLFFRRTWLLGACMLLPIIGNIVFINFTHHIPVKLNSAIYLILTAYLIGTELPRLKAFFWDHAPVAPRVFPPRNPRYRWRVWIAKAVFIVASFAYSAWLMDQIVAPVRPIPRPIAGTWKVETFEKGSGPIAEEDRWRKVLFETLFGGQDGSIKFLDDRVPTTYKIDPARRHLEIISLKGRTEPFVGTYQLLPDGRLLLQGTIGKEPARLTLSRIQYTGRSDW